MRILFSALLCALALPAFSQTLPQGVEKKNTLAGITEYSYPNGLRVLLFPDASSPKVTVNMTYLVGSRFEGYGETGMAHLLEHMNFIRSTNNRDIKKELSDHGAQFNGTTDYDRTNYFETVTASDENLRWALGLEAERMVNMRIEKALLDTEMTVVRNEFERSENDPQSVLEERVASTAYLWHNYGKATIGSRADIEKVPVDRLAAFYKKYYQPDNAVLVVAGQFDPSKALAMVADSVGKIPRPTRKLDETYTVEPIQDGQRYVELRRVGTNQALIAMWHAPAFAHPDSAALEVLTGIMTGGGGRGGGTGRLYKAMVDNKKAVGVRMGYEELHDPGFVTASATLNKDQSLDDAKKTMLDTISNVVTEPPSKDEVERAKNRILQGMQTTMSNSQRVAMSLSETIASGDWRLFFLNYDEIKNVTPEDVVRVAKLYFKTSNLTVGEFIPDAQPDRTDVPAAPDIASQLSNFKTSMTVAEGEAFDPTPANIEKHLVRSKLANGMKVALLPKATRGKTVSAQIELRFGDEKSLAGLSEVGDLTGALLMRGTKTKTRQQIQDEMVKLDARIGVSGDATGAVANIQTTEDNLIPAMRLAAELLREPSFPDSELDQIKTQQVAGTENSRTDPASLARREMNRNLNVYPRNDLRHVGTIDEDIEDLKTVTLNDLKAFHTKFYGASHGSVVVVGQFDPAAVTKEAANLLGNWTSSAPYQKIVTAYQKSNPVNLKIETPDKENSTFEAGFNLEMKDTDPDYPAMVLANYMLGGSLNSRLFDRIRNREGLSYGVNSRFTAPSVGDKASFVAAVISNPSNTPKVEASFRDEMARTLKDGFGADEVVAAQKSYHDQRVVGRSQDAALLGLIVLREEYDRTLDWDQQMDAKLAALTVDQINAAFRRHFNPDQLSIVKAGDFKKAGAYQN